MISDVGRLTDNINRILNLAKIESKNYTGEFVIQDVVTTMTSFYETHRPTFQNESIDIQIPPNETYSCSLDVPLFEMLLMNLTTNAIKYNDSKNPRIKIFFSRKKTILTISFEDNGIGLDKSEKKKIFKKFYQIGRVDNMTAQGSGLGLHLVQNIARIHKGKIQATSRGKNLGSTFTLQLPCYPSCQKESQIDSQPPAANV